MKVQEKPRYRVTAIVANVKQFRASFYLQLKAALAPFGVELKVIYSEPNPIERLKGDSIELPPPLGKKVPRCYLAGNRLLMQFPGLRDIARSDLIIIVQANGYLLNYPLLLLSALGLKKVAFWGHGYNRQGNASSLLERIKRRFVNSSDWWFAYTGETARYLVSLGVDIRKITPIENAVDTRAFHDEVISVTLEELNGMRRKLSFTDSDRIGLYCGSLYKEKRIPFLLQAAEQIAQVVPEFRLLIVGAGIEAEDVRQASENNRITHYAGPLFGRDKAVCFRMAEVYLNPGLVGLGILDSFAAGVPLVTSKDGLHSPEIDYLEHGVNGLMLEGDVSRYSLGVVELLTDRTRLEALACGARKSAEHYTVENMISNVVNGITSALEVPR